MRDVIFNAKESHLLMAAQLARPDFYDRKNEFSCEDIEGSGVPTVSLII